MRKTYLCVSVKLCCYTIHGACRVGIALNKNCKYSIDLNTIRVYMILWKCPVLVFTGGSPEKLHNILVCLHTHQSVMIAHQKCYEVFQCARESVFGITVHG